jgi:TetR/AcrR family transcriptional repressor of nem operon
MAQDDPPSTSDRSATADRILDIAQDRIQRRGYNAVSYGDLAEELDLTTAAIHYHFPSKADLVETLVRRYRRASAQKRASLRSENDTLRDQLTAYVEVFFGIMNGGGLCLCGVLAADEPTLPKEVRREVRHFFDEQEDWLTEIIAAGTTGGGGLQGCDSARDIARLFLATVEGAMLTTPSRDPTTYRKTLHALVDSIVT